MTGNCPFSRMKSLILLFVVGAFLATALQAAPAVQEDSFTRQQLKWYREYLVRIKQDLILQEKLLSARMRGIAHELERTGTDPSVLGEDLDLLLSEPQNGGPPEKGDEFALASFWAQRQQQIVLHKQAAAQRLRTRLIATTPTEAQQGYFRFELNQAIEAYAAADFLLAERLFNDLRSDYPYANLDDILFFQAEAAYSAGLWDRAVALYEELLSEFPESAWSLQGCKHLLRVRLTFGQDGLALDVVRRELRREKARSMDGECLYLMGYVFFINGEYDDCLVQMEQIKPEDAYEIRALHMISLSYIVKEEYSTAIQVLEELLVRIEPGWGHDEFPVLRDDIHLKLGYLYFETGDFDRASSEFAQVRNGSQLHADALLGRAWSGLSVSDHEEAFELAHQLVEHYPSSSLRYEAITLQGYAAEKMDRDAEAIDIYNQVLDASERNSKLRDLGMERRELIRLMRHLVQAEQDIFLSGDEAAWADYSSLRNKARVLLKRVKNTEVLTANEVMADYMDERRVLDELNEQMRELARTKGENMDMSTRQEFTSLQKEVRRLLQGVRVSGYLEISRNPLLLQERTAKTALAMLDSLATSSGVELRVLEDRIQEIDGTSFSDSHSELQASLYRRRMERLDEDVQVLRRRAAENRPTPPESDLDRWSELAFSRVAIGDIRFDELQRIEDRIRELDDYLQTIEGLQSGSVSRSTQQEEPESVPAAVPVEEAQTEPEGMETETPEEIDPTGGAEPQSAGEETPEETRTNEPEEQE